MPIHCSVYGCLNSNSSKPELSFFKLPSDLERRSKWLRLISREDLMNRPPRNYTVCEEHFSAKNIIAGKHRIRKKLKDNSLPCLQLPYFQEEDDTVYVPFPRGQKRPASTSIAQEGESDTSIDASAAAFGKSVGAQLHHLSKMQRCIAEKLISDVIYHAKMEQLSLDTTIDVKEAALDQVNVLIPKAGPSWHDTDTALDTGGQESSSSCKLLDTTEDLVRKEIAETESAVNFIKMERDETESYCFQDDEDEQNHAVDIIKEELL